MSAPALLLAPGFSHAQSRSADEAPALSGVSVSGSRSRENDSYAPARASSATRMNVPLKDTPQTVNVVTDREIRDRGARSMEDVVKGVPGVGLSHGDGQRDQVTLRGFSAIGDQYVDGFRDDALYFRDLSGIERVEIVKGPAAVLYGRGSAGGLINRITKKPGADVGTVGLSLGNWNHKRLELDAGRDFHDGPVSWRIAGAVERSGSYRDQQFLDRHSLAPSALLQLGPQTRLLLQASTLQDERLTDFGVPALNGRPLEGATRSYYGAANARDADTSTSKVHTAGFTLDHAFDSGLKLRNQFRWYQYGLVRNNTLPGTVNEAAGTVTLNRSNVTRDEDGLMNQLELTKKSELAGMQHQWLVGTEIGRQDKRQYFRSANGIATVALRYPVLPVVPVTLTSGSATDNRSEYDTQALYAQDLVSLTSQLKLLAGIRYDRFRQQTIDVDPAKPVLGRTDRAWSPRAGLVWQPDPRSSYYVSWSRSFQPSGETFALAANNADLQPERTTGYEIGARHEWLDGTASTSAALFQIERTNIKATDPVTQKLLPIGVQRVQGLELTAAADLAGGWHFNTGYAWLFGKTTESVAVDSGQAVLGKAPTLTPRHSASAWLTKDIGQQWRAGGGVQAVSGRWANPGNTVRLPGYAIFDVMAGGRLGPVDLQFNIHNLFDRAWFISGHGTSPNLNLPGPPRTYMLTARYSW